VDFKELVQVARRRWITIAAMTLVAVIAAAAYCFIKTPIYQSTAQVFISTDVANSNEAFLASAFAQGRAPAYADLADSEQLMKKVIARLDLNLTPAELQSKISASVVGTTVIIQLNARDPDPRVAQQLAQAEATEFVTYIADVETPPGKASAPIKATIVDSATYDDNPVEPKTTLYIAIALVLGLVIGAALALVRDLLDTTVKSPDDVSSAAPGSLLTHIAFDPNMHKAPLLTDAGRNSPRSEAFRLLRTNLQFIDLDQNPKSFVITSAVPGEGKTSTTTNLAMALAQAGKRVLVVDGDLRRPSIAKLLGLETVVGLTTVLVGRSTLAETIQVHQESGIHVLSSGPIPPNPTEILQSRATRDLLLGLRDMFDAVIIDAPPLLPVADAAIMATDADGAILVVRHGKTTKEQLRLAVTRLNQVNAKLYGYVVNMTPKRRRRGYDYYGYGYGDYASLGDYAPKRKVVR
jgi:receptor protein-tyrosine kinase